MSDCRVCSAPTDAFLCKVHGRDIARALGDMKSLMHEVSNLATGQTRVYRANGKPEPIDDDRWIDEYTRIPAWLRSPHGKQTLISTRPMVNLTARELLWEAGNTLSTWARELAESRGVDIPSGDWLTWLTSVSDSFRFSEDAQQAHDELTYLHRRMTSAVDRSPSRLYAGPCHANVGHLAEAFDSQIIGGRCQRDLYVKPGADEIACDGFRGDEHGCGAMHTPVSRRDWLLEALNEALVGIEEMLAATPKLFPEITVPPKSVVVSWVRNGRLMPHGKNLLGEPTFVGGEMLELMKAYRPHRYSSRRRRCA